MTGFRDERSSRGRPGGPEGGLLSRRREALRAFGAAAPGQKADLPAALDAGVCWLSLRKKPSRQWHCVAAHHVDTAADSRRCPRHSSTSAWVGGW